MIIRHSLCIGIFCFLAVLGSAQNSEFYNYIEKYSKIAVKEMERSGVPASIKLAQGILESNAGRSELARKANNHFGMKCGSSWTGRTYEKEDDDYDEFGNLRKSCFRRYRNATDCYIAHSEFLRDPRKAHIYGFLFRLDPMDYRRWAKGLRRAGYATAAGYDDKLIRLIEAYELYKYDRMAVDKIPIGETEDIIAGLNIHKVNDVKVVFVKEKITPQDIALRADISTRALKRYNDQLPDMMDTLSEGYRVYLQPKRCRYRGKRKWHYVQEGETMFDISQEYAVDLDRLYKRNRMPEGSQPQPDERIKLKGWNIKKGERPRLQSEPTPTNTVPVLIDEDEFMDEEITPQDPPVTWPSDPPTDTDPVPPSGEDTYIYHTVTRGDTLYSISRRHGTTVEQLMRLNNLTTTNLSVGQVLRVK